MRFNLLLTIMTLTISGVNSQEQACISGRYVEEVFEEFVITTVQYGSNLDAFKQEKKLFMDIYTPVGDDLEERPVMVVAHGGSFVVGQREDMAPFCERLVKQGYVCATIDYRLWPALFLGFPDSARISRTAIGAMSDMKAAVRFFRASYESGNPFGIDTNYIAVGGGSAGAITAVHVGYMDASDDIGEDLLAEINNQGGFEGNSGDSLNLNYSSKVHSVYNLSGAIFDTSFITTGDVPIFSIQGTEDEVVPYGLGKAANLVTMMGSQLIHQRADHLNIPNALVSVEGGGHSNIYDEVIYEGDLIAYNDLISDFWSQELCGLTSNTPLHRSIQQAEAFPNPSSHSITIQVPQAEVIKRTEFYTMNGQLVNVDIDIYGPQIQISHPGIKGIYVARIYTDSEIYQTRIVFN